MTIRREPVSVGHSRARSIALEQLTVSDLTFPAGLQLAPHEHQYATLGVTLEGQVDTLLQGGRRYESPANTVITKPAGEVHGNSVQEREARLIVVQADVEGLADGIRSCARVLEEVRHGPDARAGSLAWSISRELAAPDEVTPLAVDGLSRELIAVVARIDEPGEETPPRWLCRALDLIRDRLAEAITLRELAREAGVHPIHFARTFRSHLRRPLGSFVRGLRVARAAEKLVASDTSIADIALETGFADQSHLTRVFKGQLGVTPGRYRRQRAGRAAR
jgi:AraC family transcriptional regulator